MSFTLNMDSICRENKQAMIHKPSLQIQI